MFENEHHQADLPFATKAAEFIGFTRP